MGQVNQKQQRGQSNNSKQQSEKKRRSQRPSRSTQLQQGSSNLIVQQGDCNEATADKVGMGMRSSQQGTQDYHTPGQQSQNSGQSRQQGADDTDDLGKLHPDSPPMTEAEKDGMLRD